MDRYAVISVPDILETGLMAPLLFFDKIVVPDRNYVARAFREIENPKIFSDPWDPDGSRIIAEVQLGLGYYLWPTQNSNNSTEQPRAVLDDIEYLAKRGIVRTVNGPSQGSSIYRRGSFRSFLEILDEERIRMALQLAAGDLVDVNTIRAKLDQTSITSIPTALNRDVVLRFVLSQVPIPTRDISLDEILDFRNDGRVQAELSRLRSWMTKATKQYESLSHLEDEYRALYDDYKQSISRLSRKYQTSTLGIITTVAADLADNLAQLKLGSAVKSLINWQTIGIEKEEKLQSAPGRELAYLKKIEDAFS